MAPCHGKSHSLSSGPGPVCGDAVTPDMALPTPGTSFARAADGERAGPSEPGRLTVLPGHPPAPRLPGGGVPAGMSHKTRMGGSRAVEGCVEKPQQGGARGSPGA